MATLVLINATGTFIASPVTAVEVTGSGTPLPPPATNTVCLINATGTFTFDLIEAINVLGEIGAVASVSALFETSGSVSVLGEVAAVASPVYAVTSTINLLVAAPAVAKPVAVIVYKNGQETYHVGTIKVIAKPVAAVIATGEPSLGNEYGLINVVAMPQATVDFIYVTVTEVSGAVSVVAMPIAAITGNNVIWPMCFITMTLLKINGEPVGKYKQTMVNNADTGRMTLLDGWDGVRVDAAISVRDTIADNIISTDKISVTTDVTGFAQLDVFQGYNVTVTCPSLGSAVTINTTGLNTVDVSAYII